MFDHGVVSMERWRGELCFGMDILYVWYVLFIVPSKMFSSITCHFCVFEIIMFFSCDDPDTSSQYKSSLCTMSMAFL